MGPAIEFEKLMTEVVYINLPAPEEPDRGMSGGELLHGFLADFYRADNPEVKNYVTLLSNKWNVRFREKKD